MMLNIAFLFDIDTSGHCREELDGSIPRTDTNILSLFELCDSIVIEI